MKYLYEYMGFPKGVREIHIPTNEADKKLRHSHSDNAGEQCLRRRKVYPSRGVLFTAITLALQKSAVRLQRERRRGVKFPAKKSLVSKYLHIRHQKKSG